VHHRYLNFANAAWYNESGDETVASEDGTEDGQGDLDFSGVRGMIEVKRYFNWWALTQVGKRVDRDDLRLILGRG